MTEDDDSLLPSSSMWNTSTLLNGLVLAALAVATAVYGGATAFGQTTAYSLLLVAAVLLLVGLLTRQIKPRRSFAYWPISLFVLYIGVQQLVLPASFISSLSGQSLNIRNHLLGIAGQSSIQNATFSFYPFAALTDLRTILCASSAFIILLHASFDRQQLRFCLIAMSFFGLLAAVLALWQSATGAETIYGLVRSGTPFSGPFMNHSHFAQYINLSVGAVLALMLMNFRQIKHLKSGTASQHGRHAERSAKWMTTYCAVALIIAILGLSVALSRGGMVGFLVAAAIVGVLVLRSQRHGRTHGLIGVFAILIGAAVLIAGIEPAIKHFGTLENIHEAEGGRWEIVKDCISIWKAVPLVGVGLGTFQYVFPMFDTSNVPALASHAEDEYAQLLCETGLIGFGLMLTFLGFIAVKLSFLLRRNHDILQSCGQGLFFGLIAVLIHSASDFGEHAPANAIMAASVTALLVNASDLARQRRRQRCGEPVAIRIQNRWRTMTGAMPVALLMLALLWTLPSAIEAARAEPVWGQFSLSRRALLAQEPIPPRTLQSLKTTTAWLVDRQPNNVEAVFWNNYLGWKTMPRSGSGDGKTVAFSRQSITELMQAFLASTELCPTYSQNFWMAGQLQYRILHQPAGVELIRFAYDLSRNNAVVALDLAAVDLDAGRLDSASKELTRAVTNDVQATGQAISICLRRPELDSLALILAGNDPRQLLALAEQLNDLNRSPEIAKQSEQQGIERLEEDSQTADTAEKIDLRIRLADIYAANGRLDDAISLCRRASNAAYDRVDLHLKLGGLLLRTNQLDPAEHEGEICLRLQPQGTEATKFLDEVRRTKHLATTRSL